MNVKSAILAVFLLIFVVPAYGFPSILQQWRATYPDSTADDAQCQLCHANPTGGSPWNVYGWNIRSNIRPENPNAVSISEAFRLVESLDLDADERQIDSFNEFIRGFQPGWRNGENNSLFNRDGTVIANQSPPDNLPDTTAVDFPTQAQELTNPIAETIADSSVSLSLQEIAEFNSALRAVRAPGINGSLFVVEQGGRIFRTDLASGEKSLFLDVSNELVQCAECGLLGLAFHPDFASNGLFYTYQSVAGSRAADFTTLSSDQAPAHQSLIVERRLRDPSCNSSVIRRRNLLVIDQPQNNHNAGDLLFDDAGYLYISLGDGGGASDFGRGHGLLGNGRNSETILGSILRINPLGNNSANGRYGIPADNPFTESTGVDEIFAYGLRNPFRMSFDAQTGDLYAADVGQDDIEEVNRVVNGGNYGWNWKEGSFYFYHYPSGSSTNRFVSTVPAPGAPDNLIDPVGGMNGGQYDRDDGFSITGGYVYRGQTISDIEGDYIFADLGGRLFSMDVNNGAIESFILSINGLVTGFGEDVDNEIYLVTGAGSGALFKVIAADTAPFSPDAQGESPICPEPSPVEDLCFPVAIDNGGVSLVCL